MKFLQDRQQLAAMYVKVEATLLSCPAKASIGRRHGNTSGIHGQVSNSKAGHTNRDNSCSRIASAQHLPPLHNTLTHTTTMAPVTFWAAPRQYINWAARHKPAILWSLVLGSFGPLIVVCQTGRSACRQLYTGPIAERISHRPLFLLSASASATPTARPFLSHTRVSADALPYWTAAEKETEMMLEHSVDMEYKNID